MESREHERCPSSHTDEGGGISKLKPEPSQTSKWGRQNVRRIPKRNWWALGASAGPSRTSHAQLSASPASKGLQTLEVGWNAVNLDVIEAAEQMGLQIFHVDKTEKCRAELGLIWAPFKADKPPRSTDLYQPGLRVSTIMLKAWPLPYFNQQHRKDT